MAALLTSVTGNTDDVVKYINECREMGMPVEPPDINISDANFTPHGQAIRFGMGAIKNVGANAIESVVQARKKLGQFTSFYQFCENVDLRLLNKRVLESLIKSGAMDTFGHRAQLMAVVDKAIERGQKAQRDVESGQHGLFGVFDEPAAAGNNGNEKLPNLPEWDEHQRLAAEKEILGFFITGHPLQKYEQKLQEFAPYYTTEAIREMASGTGKDNEVYTAGIITNLRVQKSKKGDLYANAVLEDMLGTVDILVFPEAYRRLSDKVKLEVPVLVKGGIRVEEGANPKVTISEIVPLEDAKPKLPKNIRIRVPLDSATPQTIDELHAFCASHRGDAKVLFDLERAGDFMVIMEAEDYNVLPDRSFFLRVEELCGKAAVRIVE
jgi:DNA polymerase-3 subunit alpha